MKFLVGDSVINKETLNQGEVREYHYMYEDKNGNCREKVLYKIKWSETGNISWVEQEKLIEDLTKNYHETPLDTMLINLLIDNSLDNGNKEDFYYYTKLKKELISGDINDEEEPESRESR